jgi:hypothetical protein
VAEGLRLGALLLLVSLTGDAASATWLQTNHVVFTWIFSTAAGHRGRLGRAPTSQATPSGLAMAAGHAAHRHDRAVPPHEHGMVGGGAPVAIATVTGTLVVASAARARQLSRL